MVVILLPLVATLLSIPSLSLAQSWNSSLYSSSPSVYPSPVTTGSGGWQEAFNRASQIVSQLTLAQKASLVTGAEGPCTGNIPGLAGTAFGGLCLQNGPLGDLSADYASVFPAGLTCAASWDRALVSQRAVYLGKEFKDKGTHVGLGPVAGPLGRSAYAGRNWEGFSPDPYLTGEMFALTIEGMQSSGAQAVAKHFVGNEQETQRQPTVSKNGTTIYAISSNIDDRTMHELYMWPFANAIHSGVAAVMCSYNRLNDTYACENSKALNGLLKEELGFQGYIMSDWAATHSGVPAILAGLDMDMPGGIARAPASPSYFGLNLTTAVQNGSILVSRLDDMARRVLTPYLYLGQDSYPSLDGSSVALNIYGPIWPQNSWTDNYVLNGSSNRDVRGNHAKLIRELGTAGTVLLKNTKNALPLKSPKTIGVFGNDAGDLTNGLITLLTGEYEYGTLPVGGGSGSGRLSYVVPPLDAIKARAAQDGTLVQYVLNNTQLAAGGISGAYGVYPVPEVCLVFLKTWATEGFDRTTLETDWNGTAVVKAVASFCPNTIVITHSGGINTLPFASNPNVTAILAAHFPGQETGNSIVDILYGDVNPSGKLPYTIAHNASDYNAPIVNSTALLHTEDPNAWQADFTEGLFVDYRYFDKANITPMYEFGYGLSYTTFSISNVSITPVSSDHSITATPSPSQTTPGGNPALWTVLYNVTSLVSNTGSVAGATVAQLYVSLPTGHGGAPVGSTPMRVLRGFEKVMVQPGESVEVAFELMRRDLSFWDVVIQEWRIPQGSIEIAVGLSSRDLKGTVSVKIM